MMVSNRKISQALECSTRTPTKAALFLFVMTTMLGQTATGNPLCIAADQRSVVESILAESPSKSPAQIARTTGLTEAAVVHALPVDTRVPITLAELDGLWQKLTEWDDAVLTVQFADGVVEFFGSLPPAGSDQEYFEFGAPGGYYAARLNISRLAAIYLLSTKSDDKEIHQVAIFDKKGSNVLSVRVPRNEAGLLRSQPHIEFLRLKDAYEKISRRMLLTDLSCLWAEKDGQRQ